MRLFFWAQDASSASEVGIICCLISSALFNPVTFIKLNTELQLQWDKPRLWIVIPERAKDVLN